MDGDVGQPEKQVEEATVWQEKVTVLGMRKPHLAMQEELQVCPAQALAHAVCPLDEQMRVLGKNSSNISVFLTSHLS